MFLNGTYFPSMLPLSGKYLFYEQQIQSQIDNSSHRNRERNNLIVKYHKDHFYLPQHQVNMFLPILVNSLQL